MTFSDEELGLDDPLINETGELLDAMHKALKARLDYRNAKDDKTNRSEKLIASRRRWALRHTRTFGELLDEHIRCEIAKYNDH